jgi:hypothetical protein
MEAAGQVYLDDQELDDARAVGSKPCKEAAKPVTPTPKSSCAPMHPVALRSKWSMVMGAAQKAGLNRIGFVAEQPGSTSEIAR